MAKAKILIQESSDWLRVKINDVTFFEGPEPTARDLKELFEAVGVKTIIQFGDFRQDTDEKGEDLFDVVHEEKGHT
jgi:hypothetical protein